MAFQVTPMIRKARALQLKQVKGDWDCQEKINISFSQLCTQNQQEQLQTAPGNPENKSSSSQSSSHISYIPDDDGKFKRNLSRFQDTYQPTSYSLIQNMKRQRFQKGGETGTLGGVHQIINPRKWEKQSFYATELQHHSLVLENLPQSCSLINTVHNCNDHQHNYQSLSTSLNQHKCASSHQLAVSSCEQQHKTKSYRIPNQVKDPKECEIIKQGWLKKKSTSLFLGWQERYFVLYNSHKLVYYKMNQTVQPTNSLFVNMKHSNNNSQSSKNANNNANHFGSNEKITTQNQIEETVTSKKYTAQEIEECMSKCGEFDFNIFFGKVYVEDQKKFKLQIKGSKRSFLIECSSQKEMLSWVSTIQSSILEAYKFQYTGSGERLKIVQLKNFWKESRISEWDFTQVCDTGDILLFTSQHFASKITRMITKSTFDHIAVIIRYSSNKIAFLESALPNGVDLVDWDQFTYQGYYQNYQKIVYRRLAMERTYDKMRKLEDFIKAALKKRYKLNASKILRKKSELDYNENMKQNKSFFCSELVAGVYKNLGLLPQDKAASQYWPVSFSQKKRIKLLEGAILEEEKLLEMRL